MKLKDFNNIRLPYSKIANGELLPYSYYQELKKETERKRQFRHDWLLATFSALSGGVFGFLTSLIFWLISK